jgi:hypothetical protein
MVYEKIREDWYCGIYLDRETKSNFVLWIYKKINGKATESV